MKDIFKDLGIITATAQARLIAVERRPANLEFMLRWNTKIHTFVALWGEFDLSLKDVVKLTSLPLFNEAHGTNLYPDGEDKKRIDFLAKTLSNLKYSTSKATYLS